MAEYGVLLTTTSGEVWVTANSSPIALQARKTAALQGTSGFNTKVTHTFPAGQPVVAFVHCTVEVEITQTISGNTITIDFLRPNATGTAYVYFFSIFPQTKPGYGLAVWDASGTLILTNETRTLSDVVTLGTAGVDARLRIQHQYNSGGEVGLHACHAGTNYRGCIGWRSTAALLGYIQEHGKT